MYPGFLKAPRGVTSSGQSQFLPHDDWKLDLKISNNMVTQHGSVNTRRTMVVSPFKSYHRAPASASTTPTAPVCDWNFSNGCLWDVWMLRVLAPSLSLLINVLKSSDLIPRISKQTKRKVDDDSIARGPRKHSKHEVANTYLCAYIHMLAFGIL